MDQGLLSTEILSLEKSGVKVWKGDVGGSGQGTQG